MQDRTPRWLTTAVAVVVLGLVVWSVLDDDPASESDGAGATATSTLAESTDMPRATVPAEEGDSGASGLPVTFVDRLSPEAQETLDAVAAGGPHPHTQDGSTFFNREGLLPASAEGYYREFTVETPGSPDRGARRLVVGAGGEVFYTADHYVTFVEVVDAEV